MLNVSEAVKQRYLSDEFNGDYSLTIGNATYTGRNIQQGSLEITESLCSSDNIDFSSVEMGQVSLTLINFTEGIKDLQGKTLNLIQTVAGENVPIATGYTVVDAKNSGEYLMDIVAYDGLYKFQRDVTDWWNKHVNFPITHRNLLISLCTYCGVSYNIPASYCNSNLSIKKSIDSDTITGLEVLGWMQEVAGCFYRMNRYNVLTARSLNLKRLRPYVGLHPRTGLYPGAIDQDWVDEHSVKYTVPQIVSDLEVPDYEVAEIDKLQVSGTINDVGATAGEGTNCYKIVSNPLLFSFSAAELDTIARRIFNVLKGIKYRPFTAKLKGLPYVEPGDLVQITTLKGIVVLCPVLKRTMSGSGLAYDRFECKGNEKREQVATKSGRNLRVLNQRTHEIINTIDTLSSQITDVRTEVSEQGTKISEHTTLIRQNSESITLQATEITNLNGVVTTHTSEIAQNAANISLKVSTTDYNAATIVNMINVDTEGVKIQASKLDLEFGDTSKVTIKATTDNDGVLFDGTGKVEFNTKGEFRAKNIDSSNNEANRILLTNSSSESSAEMYNYWNNVRANDIDFTGSSTQNLTWIINNRVGADKNANNIKLFSDSTGYQLYFHNFEYNRLNSSNTEVIANRIQLYSNSTSNSINIHNESHGLGNDSPYHGNRIELSSEDGTSSNVTNKLIIRNHRNAGLNGNTITLTSDGSISSTNIANYHYGNSALTNQIWAESSSTRSLIQFRNNDYSTSAYANFVEITSNSSKNSATFFNYDGSTENKQANILQLLCDKDNSINKLILRNYDYSISPQRQNSMIQLTDSITFNAWNWFDFRFTGNGRQVIFGHSPSDSGYKCRNFYINGVDIMPLLGISSS